MNTSFKNFIIATPDDSLAITGEQAAVLYGELGQHLGRGSEAGETLPPPRAGKLRKPRTSKPE
jgi:hypothetical protein